MPGGEMRKGLGEVSFAQKYNGHGNIDKNQLLTKYDYEKN